MQEDKNIKELLQKWGVENTSADFTSHVMQRITSAYIYNTPAQPLFKQRLPQILLCMFILVCIVLFALCFTTPVTLPFQFTIKLPANYLSQGISFILIFWIVMLLNVGFKKFYDNRFNYNKQ